MERACKTNLQPLITLGMLIGLNYNQPQLYVSNVACPKDKGKGD